MKILCLHKEETIPFIVEKDYGNEKGMNHNDLDERNDNVHIVWFVDEQIEDDVYYWFTCMLVLGHYT